MKKITQVLLLVICSTGFSQENFKNQITKKDLKKSTVTFESFTNENGDVSFGFRLDSLIVGPNLVISSNGTKTYQNYNKDHEIDGTVINMYKEKDEIELFTYRKGLKNGPAFTMTGGKPTKKEQYKNDKIDLGGFKVDPPGKYQLIKGDGFSGFTMEKYENNSYAIGYFKHGYKWMPIIHVWESGESYYGQCMSVRQGFGIYAYKNGDIYVGMWDDNYREGLGFVIDKNGNITEKGFYEGGVLKTAM
jgi:hypothetical protein